MGKESYSSQMAPSSQGISKITTYEALESTNGLMEKPTKVNGSTTKCKAKGT